MYIVTHVCTGFYLEIYVWGEATSDEGKIDQWTSFPQKILNFRSPETQFRAIQHTTLGGGG